MAITCTMYDFAIGVMQRVEPFATAAPCATDKTNVNLTEKFPFNHQAPLLQQSRPNGARMLITRGGFCISVSLSEHVSITNTMMYK